MKPIVFSFAVLLLGVGATPVSAVSQRPAEDRWVWSLYENGGSLVLANEVPDTARLKATLECMLGRGTALLSLYDPQAQPGFARLTAGAATGAVEVRAARGGKIETVLRLDHPVFTTFVAQGSLTVTAGERQIEVSAAPEFQPLLRQFAERCGGVRP
ncbi:hypothetical protein [Brevundimonas sp. PAMC22021]|uniref:hypothetical protein n=1 Tax=Brevundimonas sp. PAMC22021 TaxID=2861285 RepID=UPI001C630939|nr:hypothetical protein [Brevundimonas sp. PAMC22021]QYF87413.1 hypothetical protein KY493_02595 [Brevundimonas sp. PAMC22021]